MTHADDAGHRAPGGTHVAVGDTATMLAPSPRTTPGEKVRRLFHGQAEADERGNHRQPGIARGPARQRGPGARPEGRDAARGEKAAAAERLLELQDRASDDLRHAAQRQACACADCGSW